MSIISNRGENITQALNILLETYENLELLFTDMDKEAEQTGFVSHTERFLRWKSDANYDGWLTGSFIKLYQFEGEKYSERIGKLLQGDMYAVDVNLKEIYPKIWLCRYRFDYAVWRSMPATSDHWLFSYPFNPGYPELFKVEDASGNRFSIPTAKARKTYWGLQGAVAVSLPLVAVDSAQAIRTEIFDRLRTLPEPC